MGRTTGGNLNGNPSWLAHMTRERSLKRPEDNSEHLEKPVKKKPKELNKREDLLSSVFTASPLGIAFTDLNGRIIECNQAALDMHSYASKEELVGKSAFELIAKKDHQRAMENLRKTLRQGSVKEIEYSFLTKNGHEFCAELSASLVRDASGRPSSFIAFTKDISKRKKAEELLGKSERRFRSVVDNVGIGIATISPNMEILSLNDQMKKWFPNIDVSENPTCYEAFNNPPRQEVCPYCPTCRTLKDGSVHEAITETPSGNEFRNYHIISTPLKNESGEVEAAIEMVEDATERRRIEKQLEAHAGHLEELVEERTGKLQDSEEHFRSVANSASEAIVTVDMHWNIVFWNKAAETTFGYSAEEAVGKPITLVMPKWARKRHQKVMGQMATKKVKADFHGKSLEIKGLRKDGAEFPLELSFSNWRTKKGIFFTAILRDITERKKLEERLSALNSYGKKLNMASNLEAIYGLTLDAMALTLGFEYAAFMIVNKEKLRPVQTRGYPTPLNFELPLDGTEKGVTVRAATARKTCLIPDVTRERDYVKGDPHRPIARSELAVPVMVEDEVLGVLNVESTELDAFSQKDAVLLQILASHAATAISNLETRREMERRSNQQSLLMRSSTQIMHTTDLGQRLQAISEAIKELGWRRVVISARDENLDITRAEDIVTAGLSQEETDYLWANRQSGSIWKERLGPQYDRFRIGEFYYLPWSDPWVRKRFSEGTVPSKLSEDEMVDWHPQDLLYAPLKLADGRIVGVVSMDDPLDGRKPSRESLAPLEMFLHQAAVAVENARLIRQLNEAKNQIQEYAGQLEIKVRERTKELMETQSLLLRSERLAAIGQLAGMVGHDLRNPLTGIAGAAYYLKTRLGPRPDKKFAEMLGLIQKDIEYSNKIINDLLEYSREIKLELTETRPKSIIKETLYLIKMPKNVKIIERTQSKPKLKLDMEKTQRVFTNIIKNALDAMPKGGTLTLGSRRMGDCVEFSFSDTGTGMSQETLNRIWTPLFTTKAKGMGFGLPICKRIVEAHGGRISARSQFGRGTTLTVTVPIKPKTEEGGEKVWVNMPEFWLSTMTKA